MDSVLILYDAADAGPDGYPEAWHNNIKHSVRMESGHRCIRCKHPYKNGEHGNGEWSPCDSQCTHAGPCRLIYKDLNGDPVDVEHELGRHGHGLAISCGKTVLARYRILTVHHLDGNKLNCRWWNLAALCQRCHLTIQGRVKMHRPYFLEHSEWFKPYVAGFYASTILGVELSRDEVMGRLDELLALASREVAYA